MSSTATTARTRAASDELITADSDIRRGDRIDVDGYEGAVVIYAGVGLVRIQPDRNCSATNTYTRDELIASHARFSHAE